VLTVADIDGTSKVLAQCGVGKAGLEESEEEGWEISNP
jgi:hypothetical protein